MQIQSILEHQPEGNNYRQERETMDAEGIVYN